MPLDATHERQLKPGEEVRLAWDFVNDLNVGDSVTGQSVTAADSDGVDVTGTFLAGPTISGTKIVVETKPPVGGAGKDFTVTFQATTSQGDVFKRALLIMVRA